MEIIVSKFGGSSLADARQFKKVKEIIDQDPRRKFIIPSAPGKRHGRDHKITDLFYMCYQLASHGLNFDEVFNIIRERFLSICQGLKIDLNMDNILEEIKAKIEKGSSKDYCGSRGEYLNGLILSKYLNFHFLDPKDFILFTDNGELDQKATEHRLKERVKNIDRAVIPGFYGARKDGQIKTFSRGGSDVTGSIVANGLGAILYENWTDVSGFLMADPNIVKEPNPIEEISYKELRELSYMGAPVLHEEALFPIKNSGIPINIKNTNAPKEPGTMILDDESTISYPGTITGIAGKKDFTAITVEKTLMSRDKGFLRKLISVMETNNIFIEHMPSSIDSISLIVSNAKLGANLQKIIEEIRIYCNPDNIVHYNNMALIAVVGRGMIRTKGISAKVFTALAEAGINIRMITQGSSELNIIVGVDNSDFEKAIRAIYKVFN